MMHRYPKLVKLERAIDNPHPPKQLYRVDPSFKGDTLCYIPSSAEEMEQQAGKSGGTSGETSRATAKDGKIYHDHLVSRLVQVIRAL